MGLSCNTDIIMLDETYDGLDPLAKKAAAKKPAAKKTAKKDAE